MSKVATAFFRDNGEFCQVYHSTIVTREGVDQAGRYCKVFSGGWWTQTTKSRINDVIHNYGWRLVQRAYTFLLVDPHGVEHPFEEGYIIR